MTTRTPSDIHVGAVVILPSGAVGKVTSRHPAGPLMLWGVNDQHPCWLDSDLRLPDEPERSEKSPKCRAKRHNECGGGWAVNGELYACTFLCGHVDGQPRAEARA